MAFSTPSTLTVLIGPVMPKLWNYFSCCDYLFADFANCVAFVPVFVQVAATPSSFLGVCWAKGNSCPVLMVFPQVLHTSLPEQPLEVQVESFAPTNFTSCPVAGMTVRSLMVVLQTEQYSLPLQPSSVQVAALSASFTTVCGIVGIAFSSVLEQTLQVRISLPFVEHVGSVVVFHAPHW